MDGHYSGRHLGRDEPASFWFPWVAQCAPGISPSSMPELDIYQYLLLCEMKRQADKGG